MLGIFEVCRISPTKKALNSFLSRVVTAIWYELDFYVAKTSVWLSSPTRIHGFLSISQIKFQCFEHGSLLEKNDT